MANKLKNTSVNKSISNLYLQDELADVKFAFKYNGTAELVPAHKLILASGSPVFRTMFFGSLPEKEIVQIVDASADAFKEFLQFFYLPEITLTMDHTDGVARLADKYDMLDSLNTCATFLEKQLTNENMFWGYQLAISLNNKQLKRFCAENIAYLASDLFKTNLFLQCDQKVLKSILQIDQLACDEVDVFNACVEWAKTSCRKNQLKVNSEHLKRQLGDCFYLIRFSEMKSEEIGALMTNKLHAGMFSRDELLEILCTTTAKHFQPSKFNQSARLNLSFERNTNPILICSPKNGNQSSYYSSTSYNNQSKESVWFSTNRTLLLGKFQCPRVYLIQNDYDNRTNGGGSANFNVNIFEYNSGQTTGKILYTGIENLFEQENNQGHTVRLTRSILIKPEKKYEIRLEHSENLANVIRHSNKPYMVNHSIKLNEAVTITFHETIEKHGNVSSHWHGNNTISSRGCLLSSLYFKTI